MKAWFISDIHLKNLNERNGNILLRFLHSLANNKLECTHLFLLGDIFDIWVGSGDFHYKRFQAIVDLIHQLKLLGKEIYYFEGNHDVYVSDFWKNKMNIKAYVEDEYFNLAGKIFRISHGDKINPQDIAYERYRKFYRNPLTEKLLRLIPEKPFYQFGIWASQTSRKYSSQRRDNNSEELRQMIRNYAIKSYEEKKFDFLISGHMHVADEYSFKSSTSINLGSWFEQPRALWIDMNSYGWSELK